MNCMDNFCNPATSFRNSLYPVFRWIEHRGVFIPDVPLPRNYKDHKLSGEYEGYRECHIKNDILIIYRIDVSRSLLIMRSIGTHDDFF